MRSIPALVFGLVAVLVACAGAAAFAAPRTAPLESDSSKVASVIDVADHGGLGEPAADRDLQTIVRELAPSLAPVPTPDPTVAPRAGPAVTPHLVLRVPVLMYHYISAVPADQANDKVAVDLRVPPELFEQHLAYLQAQGYTSVSAPLLWDAINRRATLPAKAIVLTFDDGYVDAYTNALPLLQKYGFRGTFFVTVNLVGRPGYMTWDQVKALDAAGMDIESHAMDHKPMTAFTMAGLAYQMGQARAELGKQLGHEVRFFAYPSGDYNALAMQGAANFGYDAAFLKSGGALQSVDWAYALRRSRVNGAATVDMLKVSLAR